MSDEKQVAFLRGAGAKGTEEHPILELSEDELRIVIGGMDSSVNAGSTDTGSYYQSGNPCTFYCCDGVKVCCNSQEPA